jgi:8-oxo-dGTP pyrophosphatase MutT (NUDIX family)
MWKETWKTHSIATGKLIELYEKEYEIEGRLKLFEHARRPPGVRLIFEKWWKILLTKEYRGEHKSFDYRLPGGKVFDQLKDMKAYTGDMLEVAKDAAVIEAREECGIIVEKDNMILFHLSHCWAMIEWDLYYFSIREFEETGFQDLWEDEYITFDWYSFDEIMDLVREWKISEDRSKWVLWEYYLKNHE